MATASKRRELDTQSAGPLRHPVPVLHITDNSVQDCESIRFFQPKKPDALAG